ncbi:YopX family protein [Flavobacterium sp. RSP15]|uniref:YopX family protein n=1 Tax=Flavobacterium sp. RSP15 TaxID=2497485 RepID=UPI000F83D89C|nr:YopX family protein [Flavobacterium sp. RSP15]RTY86947.1 hypothetical protein EKM00_08855 [Flavobacterium sp. RSP15]
MSESTKPTSNEAENGNKSKPLLANRLHFRAWIEKQKYMAIQGKPDLETLQSFMFHFGDEAILMESTLLKDSKGKEIFEGDILKFMHHLHKVFRVRGGLVINSHLDDFCKDSTPFYEACADMQTSQWIEQCEIIGNIFQNPELLVKAN